MLYLGHLLIVILASYSIILNYMAARTLVTFGLITGMLLKHVLTSYQTHS
jgi:hypothetical protein